MKPLFSLFFLISTSFLFAQSDRILVDEDYDDWQNVPIAHTDPSGDSGNSNIDFGNLWIGNDDEFIFFRIELGDVVNLQDNNEITIYLDTDNNATTGLSTQGMGAEIVYNFGNRSGTVYVGNNNIFVAHGDIWLTSLPTVTSDEFEIAISRDLTFFGQDLYQGNSIRVLFKNGANNADQIPNDPGGIAYTFDNSSPAPLPDYSINQPEDTQLRIMSYNVLFDNLFENSLQSYFNQIISSIDADIIGFQEIYDHTSTQTVDKVESFLPSLNGAQWYHAKVQPDIIAVSRFPIIDSYLIAVNSFSVNGNGAFLIDLDPATNTKLLFIVAHTPCCDNNFERQQEIDAIMAFVRDAKDGTGPVQLSQNDPIVILGDMNLVGDNQQQTTLISGDIVNQTSYGAAFNPDWDGSDLEDAKPLASNLPLAITWYRTESSFAPGRLDYLLYTGSVMDLKNTYSLFTPALSLSELADYNLGVNDAVLASDHLPVVGDFELDITLASKNIETASSITCQVFPNPLQEDSNLMISLRQRSDILIELFDINGQRIKVLYQGELPEGTHQLKMNAGFLANGVYICRLTSIFGLTNRKVIVSK